MLRRSLALVLPLLGLVISAVAGPQQSPSDALDMATQYLSATTDDPIARLQKRIDSGETVLNWSHHGYLEAVLKELKVSPKSQTLVFSKTSLQRDRISPKTPRAVYFNDHCYVGWCQDGVVVEISIVDPRWGAIFYTLPQTPTAKPRFQRQSYECLQCHSSPMTQNIPGHAVRSVYPMLDGNPDLRQGTYLTTDQSPLDQRWGGWYVTGRHGKMRHMGNAIARSYDNVVELDREAGANILDLRRFFDVKPYLTPHSDIVALLVLEHQANLHNLFTRAQYTVNDALRDEARMNEALKETGRRDSTVRRIAHACEPVVQALLFSGETPLTAPVIGTSGFENEFSARGPKDSQGRSLCQLDLTHRLLRYPCSWLIYSDAFTALPPQAKEYIGRRLEDVLSGKDQTVPFAHLSASDRQAIRGILRETRPGLLPDTTSPGS